MGKQRLVAVILSLCLAECMVLPEAFAANQNIGGAGPFFASCCIGPRVGLEMNEGKEIKGTEWFRALGVFVPYVGGLIWLVAIVMQGSNNGFNGVMAECCIGPRVGEELRERRIRSIEWVSAIPLIGLIPRVMIASQAAKGQTMLEVEAKEHLRREPKAEVSTPKPPTSQGQ